MILTLSLAGCGMASTTHPASPHRASAQPQPLQLRDITMVSAKNGWALSSKGVVLTTDGGSQWTSRNPKTLPLTLNTNGGMDENIAAAFPSSKEAIIAQETASAIRIWKTNNGGVNWIAKMWRPLEAIIQNNFGGAIQMQFLNAQTGLMVLSSQGNAGSLSDVLLATTDGGIHWHQFHSMKKISAPYLGPSPSSTLADVGALTVSPSGWGMASVNTVITGRAWVLTTANGGRSWSSRALPLPRVSIYDSVAEGVPAYQGDESGWLWLSLFNNHTAKQRWLVEHTTNRGEQWASIPWNHAVPQSSTLGGVFLWPLPQRVLLLVADSHGTGIWQLTSRSAEWKMVSHLPVVQINSVSLLSSGIGWVVGNTGSYQTTNGGVTWSKFSPKLVK